MNAHEHFAGQYMENSEDFSVFWLGSDATQYSRWISQLLSWLDYMCSSHSPIVLAQFTLINLKSTIELEHTIIK